MPDYLFGVPFKKSTHSCNDNRIVWCSVETSFFPAVTNILSGVRFKQFVSSPLQRFVSFSDSCFLFAVPDVLPVILFKQLTIRGFMHAFCSPAQINAANEHIIPWIKEVQDSPGTPSLSLIITWITNYNHCKVWDEIAYQFSNFHGAAVEAW